MIILETPRLSFRQLTWADLDALATLYTDPVVMTFLGGTRSLEVTRQQLERLLGHYEQYGFGLWATIHKADNRWIGRCGLLPHPDIDGQPEVEIGYTLAKDYWGQGLATEAAAAIRDYGFNQLGRDRLISLISPANLASQKVATKIGLTHEKDVLLQNQTVRVYAIAR